MQDRRAWSFFSTKKKPVPKGEEEAAKSCYHSSRQNNLAKSDWKMGSSAHTETHIHKYTHGQGR